MIGWSLFNAYFALFLTQVSGSQLSGAGFLIDFVMLLSCLLQLMVGSLLLRLPIRLPVAGSLLGIFATWGAATTLFANGDFGRSLYAPIQYYVVWGFFAIFIYAAVEMGVNLAPSVRRFVVVPWIVMFAVSGFIGLLQMLGVGFALALSPSQAFGIVFRPTGLTDYTFLLGMQGVFGMALIGSRLIARDLKFWEWLTLGGFMLVVLIAQYRSLYYTGLLLMGIAVLFLQFRRDRAKAIGLGLLAVGLVVALLVLFPAKFAYGLRGTEGDTALQARYDSWQQLKPVLATRPLTGIGADQNLMIGPNLANIDKYAGTVIDNFYRMVLICYGYTGGLFMIMTLTGLGLGIFMRYLGSTAPEVKLYTLAAGVVFLSLLGVSMTGNSFVYRQVGYSFAVLLALGTPSWKERKLIDPVSPMIALARSLARTPMRVLFPNLGRVR